MIDYRSLICSTPEGVIVSIAVVSLGGQPRKDLLNARGRHRLDRQRARLKRSRYFICSTPEGVIVSIAREIYDWFGEEPAAQRPRASSSRSLAHRGERFVGARLLNARGRHRLDRLRHAEITDFAVGCSTPEGVIVSIAISGPSTAPRRASAQRPRASSSRYARRSTRPCSTSSLLNARGRHRLDHVGRSASQVPGGLCSTPEGVIVSIARRSTARSSTTIDCSTPEGVIVSIARQARRASRRLRQLLNARGRHRLDHVTTLPDHVTVANLLNARGRHRLDHAASRPQAQGSRRLLNARGRHRLDHAGNTVTVAGGGSCSTPEGVIVSIAAGGTISRRRFGCSTPEGVIVSIA